MGVRQSGHSGFSLHHSMMQFLHTDHDIEIIAVSADIEYTEESLAARKTTSRINDRMV